MSSSTALVRASLDLNQGGFQFSIEQVWSSKHNTTDANQSDDKGSTSRAILLLTRGENLLLQSADLGNLIGLDEAIRTLKRGLAILPNNHTSKHGSFGQLGYAYYQRYKHSASLKDIEAAIEYTTQALDETSEDESVLPIRLGTIGSMHICLFKHSGKLSHADMAIEFQTRAVALMKDSTDLSTQLGNLGVAYNSRFQYSGQLADIERGIEYLTRAVLLAPEEATWLGNLGCMHDNRFERLGNLIDTEMAIQYHHRAVMLTPDSHPCLPTRLSNLGSSHVSRFDQLGKLDDIDEAIKHQKRVIAIAPKGHQSFPIWLNNLGASFRKRFDCHESLADIDDAIDCYTRAIETIPHGHPSMPTLLSNLGLAHSSRFERLGEIVDLDKTIEFHTRAIALTPEEHVNLPTRLGNLGTSYLKRFIHLGEPADIDKAIEYHLRVIKIMPHDHASFPGWLSGSSGSLERRFRRLGYFDDIDKAIEYQRLAISLTPDYHADFPIRVNNLGVAHRLRFERLGDLVDINAAIECQTRAVSLTSEEDASLPLWITNLGISYGDRFEHSGDPADIDEAIKLHGRAVKLTPEGHAKLASRLNSLGRSYNSRFNRYNNLVDIDKAIEYYSRAIGLAPEGHQELPIWLNNLAISYSARFLQLDEITDIHDAIAYHVRDAADIDMAIEYQHYSIRLTPVDSPRLPGCLGLLGSSYALRFRLLKNPGDNDKAIEFQTRGVSLAQEGHAYLPMWMSNLGWSHNQRFEQSGNPVDLEKAIEYHTRAVKLTPEDHPLYPLIMSGLGCMHRTKLQRLNDQSSLIAALNYFKAASESPVGHPGLKMKTALAWAQVARSYNSPDELKAYQIAMDLVPQLVWIGSTIHMRHQSVLEIKILGTTTASAAIRTNNYELALEWLEQARSVIWSQTLQLHTPLDHLRAINKSIADDFQQTAQSLHMAGVNDRPPNLVPSTSAHIELEQTAQEHHRLAEKYNRMLLQIRQLPGFGNFLKPKVASELVLAAWRGPVVVINCHDDGSDSLILQPGGKQVRHVPLAGFSQTRALEIHSSLESAIGSLGLRGSRKFVDKRKSGRTSGAKLASALHILWVDVAWPIINSLGCERNVPLEQLPHVTWCPIGTLSCLPLHAAGIYTQPQEKLSDFVVSSFVPTLGTLLPPRDPILEPNTNAVSGILAIGQPATPGQTRLPGAIKELVNIKCQVQSATHYTELLGENATPEAVINAMEHHDSIHLACHAYQDTEHPSESGFFLHKGTLNIAEIRKKHFKSRGLAFLSACQTATGDRDIPDEAIHLASSMLSVGYSSVIATMWSVKDEDTPFVAGIVYKELLKDGKIHSERAARSLHRATVALRKKIEDENSKMLEKDRNPDRELARWVPFIHMGV